MSNQFFNLQFFLMMALQGSLQLLSGTLPCSLILFTCACFSCSLISSFEMVYQNTRYKIINYFFYFCIIHHSFPSYLSPIISNYLSCFVSLQQSESCCTIHRNEFIVNCVFDEPTTGDASACILRNID